MSAWCPRCQRNVARFSDHDPTTAHLGVEPYYSPRQAPARQPSLPAWSFSEDVLAKAARYLKEHRVSRDERPGIYYVAGSQVRPYVVQTDADPVTRMATWVSCTCAHGANVGAGTASCSHAAAVLGVIRSARLIPVRAHP